MSRFARVFRVVYWEEPLEAEAGGGISLDRRVDAQTGIEIITPRAPAGLSGAARNTVLEQLLGEAGLGPGPLVRWYYSPMMLPFSRRLEAACTVYDCMDELTGFRFAPPELAGLEQELLGLADVVFTGGYSLWEAKRSAHANIHPFPSAVDKAHFAVARDGLREPHDQPPISGPRLGFYGVVDERMDTALLAAVADAHPEWTLVVVGPVVKIDPADLPRRPNLHYLGGKTYNELPAYLAGWDVALMPFAINEATRFISPTKTPEYLAAGRPVVSTPIVDVVRHWGASPGVIIADGPAAFVAGCERALVQAAAPAGWLAAVDEALAKTSWDETFQRMWGLIDAAVGGRRSAQVIELSPGQKSVTRPRPHDALVVGAGFGRASP